MGKLGDFDIPFVKLKNGEHHFSYTLNDDFFGLFEYSPIQSGNLNAEVEFIKDTTLFNLHFTMQGTVRITCDDCLNEIDFPVESDFHLVVKLVENPGEEEDEILYLNLGESEVNIARYLYEMVTLALPIRRTCGNEGDTSQCNTAMIEKLNALKHAVKEEDTEGESNEGKETDPRWDKLKDMFN